jgi:L-serine dehydratase
MIHQVAEAIAKEGINIASLSCSRKERGKDAFMQVDVDSPLSQEALGRILAIEEMQDARYLDRIP